MLDQYLIFNSLLITKSLQGTGKKYETKTGKLSSVCIKN